MKPFRIESAPLPNRRRRGGWLDLASGAAARDHAAPAQAHVPSGEDLALIRRELSAIGSETCSSAQRILIAAEELSAFMQARGLDSETAPLLATLFEACSFQDLTGQRIGKILATLEGQPGAATALNPPCPPHDMVSAVPVRPPQADCRHVAGLAAAAAHLADLCEDEIGRALVNGPRLADEDGHMGQADIDALFD